MSLPNPAHPPLSLYVHFPWCVKKCPYCDFNSYALGNGASISSLAPELEQAYLKTLIRDLKQDLPYVFERPLISIFLGGGTPSLFSPQSFETLINEIQKDIAFDPNIEITMEANPGTLEHKAFKDYKYAGINRVSLGVQSFQADKLKALGRVHDVKDIEYAMDSLHQAELHNFNIDLMYGLPHQTTEDALSDLDIACRYAPSHISWYHLTLEPNTYFHKYPPALPPDEIIETTQNEGWQLLQAAGYHRYEISAYAKQGKESRHNLNYWTFGDYLGIGAGAHGKITEIKNSTEIVISRYAKTRMPKDYFSPNHPLASEKKALPIEDLPLEFMMNALRLMKDIPLSLFEARCFLPREHLKKPLAKAKDLGLIMMHNHGDHDLKISLTPLGKRFLNNVLELF